MTGDSRGGLPGIDLTPGQVERLARYRDLLLDWRERANLTSITGPEEIQQKLILQSLHLLKFIPAETVTAADVGSGAGFPGIPLAIASSLRMTLVEADRMKCAFLERAAVELGLRNVHIDCRRAELVGRDPECRETFDLGLARAVAPLPVVLELVLPLVRVEGTALLPKGGRAGNEVERSRRALSILGGEAEVADVENTHVVIVKKVRPTPDPYPRRPGVPARRPL